MKKIIAILLAALVAVSALALASETDVATDTNIATGTNIDAPVESATLTGLVQEITDEYVLILTQDGMQVQANLTEDVLFMLEGIAIGDSVFVTYDGKMTRSLPAQITLESIISQKLVGVVEELTEEGFLLRVEGEDEPFYILADESQMTGILVDMPVTVFFNGMMTRSLPPQVTAMHVRLMEISGLVAEVTEGGFILTDADGVQYEVKMSEETIQLIQPGVGEAVCVTYNGVATMSLPAQIGAMEILPYYEVMPIAQ